MTTSNMSLVLQDTVMIFIINSKQEVLLYRRINTWYEPNKLALIGGLVDEGESFEQAVAREVKEETSLVIDMDDLNFLTTVDDVYDDTLYKNHYYYTRKFSGTPSNLEPEKCAELVWHSLTNLPDDTITIIKTLTEEHDSFR